MTEINRLAGWLAIVGGCLMAIMGVYVAAQRPDADVPLNAIRAFLASLLIAHGVDRLRHAESEDARSRFSLSVVLVFFTAACLQLACQQAVGP